MPSKQIEVADLGVINLYKRRNARSIKITLQPKGAIRVTIPNWLPYKAGLEYAKSKRDWIKKHQKTDVKLLEGMRIGKYHRLIFIPANKSSVASHVSDSEIKITYPANLNTHHTQVQSKAVSACERALRQEASHLLPQRLDQLAKSFGYEFNGVSIKKLKSRWGSCNHRQHITLNLYLMLLPWELIDYVLLHELNHTKHLNHSPSFWNDIESNMPKAKQYRRQLRAFQPAL